MAWTNRVIFPGFIMWATVLWLFGCLASLDGPLVTNSLFSQTWLSTISSWALLEPSIPSRVEREETLNTTFMGGLGGQVWLILAIHASAGTTMIRRDNIRKKKTTQAVKATPHINQGKGATLVPSTVKLLHREKERKINGDQEGCRLGLKPAPNESW